MLILMKKTGAGVPATTSVITTITFRYEGMDSPITMSGTDGTETYNFGSGIHVNNGDVFSFTAANAGLTVFEPILRINMSDAAVGTVDLNMIDPITFNVDDLILGGDVRILSWTTL